MVAQPPVWMYSSETPFTYPFNLSLMEPGGRMWRAGGERFWMTTTSPTSFVMILLNPEKSWRMVPDSERKYGRGF